MLDGNNIAMPHEANSPEIRWSPALAALLMSARPRSCSSRFSSSGWPDRKDGPRPLISAGFLGFAALTATLFLLCLYDLVISVLELRYDPVALGASNRFRVASDVGPGDLRWLSPPRLCRSASYSGTTSGSDTYPRPVANSQTDRPIGMFGAAMRSSPCCEDMVGTPRRQPACAQCLEWLAVHDVF